MRGISGALLLLLVVANDFSQSDSWTPNPLFNDRRRFVVYDASQCDNYMQDDNGLGNTQETSACIPLVRGFHDDETIGVYFENVDTQISVFFQDTKSGNCLIMNMDPFNNQTYTVSHGSFDNSSKTAQSCDSKGLDGYVSLPLAFTKYAEAVYRRDNTLSHYSAMVDVTNSLLAAGDPDVSFSESYPAPRYLTVERTGITLIYRREDQFDRVCISRATTREYNYECYPHVPLENGNCVSFAGQTSEQIFPTVYMTNMNLDKATLTISLALDDDSVRSVLSIINGNSTINIDIDPSIKMITVREKFGKVIKEPLQHKWDSLNTKNIEISMEYSREGRNKLSQQLTVGGQRMEHPFLTYQASYSKRFHLELKLHVIGGVVKFNHVCHGHA